jgi:hypothetical protein
MVDLYSFFQVSETNEMIILFILLVMFFVIFYDIFSRFLGFPKVTNIIISAVITMMALLSGIAIRTVHIILGIGVILGVLGFFGLIILMFVAFALLHLGLGKLAFLLRRRR